MLGGLGWATGWIGGDETGLSVETETAERRTVTEVVTAFGRAQPEVEVTISPDVSGEIVELPVQEGDEVQRGDLLARLRPDDYRAQLEQRRAEVSQRISPSTPSPKGDDRALPDPAMKEHALACGHQ